MEKNTIERIAGLEMQIKIFKWVVGSLFLAIMTVSGSLGKWVYAQGSDVNVLKNELNTQVRIIQTHEEKIEKSAEKVGNIDGDIRDTKNDIKYMKKSLDEIKELLINDRPERRTK